MPLIGAHDVGEGEERGEGERDGEGEGDEDGEGEGAEQTAIDNIIRTQAHAMRIAGRRRYRRCCKLSLHKQYCYLTDSIRLRKEEH